MEKNINWIISINKENEGVSLHRFYGTMEEAKLLMTKMVERDRAWSDQWVSGTTETKNIKVKEIGGNDTVELYGYGTYETYSIEYTAFQEENIRDCRAVYLPTPPEKKDYVLTKKGEEEVAAFLDDCEAYRKAILEAGKDTALETELPTREDIISDLCNGIAPDIEGDYFNYWGVTDNLNSEYPLCLTIGKDFVEAGSAADADS